MLCHRHPSRSWSIYVNLNNLPCKMCIYEIQMKLLYVCNVSKLLLYWSWCNTTFSSAQIWRHVRMTDVIPHPYGAFTSETCINVLFLFQTTCGQTTTLQNHFDAEPVIVVLSQLLVWSCVCTGGSQTAY